MATYPTNLFNDQGEFQIFDLPVDAVPLNLKDPRTADLLWEHAMRLEDLGDPHSMAVSIAIRRRLSALGFEDPKPQWMEWVHWASLEIQALRTELEQARNRNAADLVRELGLRAGLLGSLSLTLDQLRSYVRLLEDEETKEDTLSGLLAAFKQAIGNNPLDTARLKAAQKRISKDQASKIPE